QHCNLHAILFYQYLINTFIPAIKTRTAVILFTINGFHLMDILDPICPPIKTERHKIPILEKFISTDSFENCPAIPDIELTRINTLEVAAIFLAVSHFIKLSNGDKNIPPPIPTNPDKKPIPPPNKLFCTKIGL